MFFTKRLSKAQFGVRTLSFRNRLFLLVVISILVPVLIFGLLSFAYFDQQLKQKLADQLNAELKIFSMLLDHRRDSLQQGLERFVTDNTLQVTLDLGIDSQLKNYLSRQLKPLGFSAIGIYDNDGKLIAQQGSLSAACIADEGAILQQGELCMWKPVSKNGKLLGTAVAAVAVADEAFHRQISTELSSHVFLTVDAELILSDPQHSPSSAAIRQLQAGISGDLFIDQDRYIAMTDQRDYCGSSVVLGAMFPYEKEYLGYWTAAAKIAAVLLLVALLVVAVMQKFVRDLLRPVGALIRAASLIEQGSSQPLPLDCRRADELGILNRAFVNMVTTRQEHEDLLERQVAERTSELVRLNKTLEKDIEARKQAESAKQKLEHQLHQTQKMEALGTMAGGIAHDMNNTLVPIFAFTELVMRKLPEHDDNWKRLQKVCLAAKRCRDLVGQILTFSRQSHLDKAPIQPNVVLRETVNLLRATTPATIEICAQVDEDCGQLLANESQIHQVMLNLCTNAVQAMGQSGTLQVNLQRIEQPLPQVRLRPPFVRVEVKDSGCGMSEQVMARVFEPFFTTKEVGKGTGMGLSVVHGIVKAHDGEIRVASRPGEGTQFSIYLPVLGKVPPVADDPVAPMLSLAGSERILLVDDEPEITASWSEYLGELGYQLTCVNSAGEVSELLRHSDCSFDLLVSDQTMPLQTGLQLARKLRLSHPELPILLCTGDRSALDEEALQGTAIRKVLLKPLTGSELAVNIRQLLDLPV